MSERREHFLRVASALLSQDDDHLEAATDDELAWLAAQLASWPVRVDEEFTTSHRFLLTSAAQFIVESLEAQAA